MVRSSRPFSAPLVLTDTGLGVQEMLLLPFLIQFKSGPMVSPVTSDLCSCHLQCPEPAVLFKCR